MPLFAAFCWFVWTGLKTMGPATRQLTTPASIAALAAYSGLVSCVVLMIFDPHITYRGSADALFGLDGPRRWCSTRRPAEPATHPSIRQGGTS